MIKYHFENAPYIIAEVQKGLMTINTSEDILDLMGDIGTKECSRIIIHMESFSKDFFDLRSGLVGEILQKFSNYQMKLAIVGDFTELKSKSWVAFIRESNRGRTVRFVSTVEEAIASLTNK